MSGTKISKLVLGVVLLLVLGTLVIVATSRGDLVGLAAEVVATSAPPPTPTSSLAWKNATLDQIHFGEPKVVLTDTPGLRIVRWISDEEVLILRDIEPGRGNAIEVFNVEDGKVRRLVEGNIWGKPIWSPQANAITYLRYDEEEKVEKLIWQPIDGETRSLQSEVVQPVVLAPAGRGAMAYSIRDQVLVGRSVVPAERRRVELSFAPFAPPGSLSVCAWKYDTAVSPDGKWQVVYNCKNFLLVNSENGTIKQLDLGTEVIEGRPFSRWALDAQWSQDGRQLAIASTFGDFLPRITRLLVLDPWGEVREIRHPPGIIFSEVDWAPGGKYLLVSGLEAIGEGTFSPRMWLVDVKRGRIRNVDLLPVARSEDPRGGAAWSPDGKHLLFYCHPQNGSGSALCLASVEVER